MKQLIAFDLDGTLAESKQPVGDEMASALAGLLAFIDVGVISGGDWPQFEMQVVSRLPVEADLSRLWIMPTTGAKLYRFKDGSWTALTNDSFSEPEKTVIQDAIHRAIDEVGLIEGRLWGDQIEDRGTQFTFSGLGQQAPLDAKKRWDPDFAKRKALQVELVRALPNLSVNIGGSTSLDITHKGVDKGFGLRRLARETGFPLSALLFVGDAVYPGGNDYPAREAGVETIAVRDVAETLTLVETATAILR
jgi:hypothetical protein